MNVRRFIELSIQDRPMFILLVRISYMARERKLEFNDMLESLRLLNASYGEEADDFLRLCELFAFNSDPTMGLTDDDIDIDPGRVHL